MTNANDPASILFGRDVNPFNTTWEDWSIAWWNWLMGIGKADSPANDATGANHNRNQTNQSVFFLAGVTTPFPFKADKGKATRGSTDNPLPVQRTKAILFPLINDMETLIEKPALGSAGLPGAASDDTDRMVSLQATFDAGTDEEIALLTGYLSTYRVGTRNRPNLPQAQTATFPLSIIGGDLFDLNPGPALVITTAAADGYYIFIKDNVWQQGSRHTIHFRALEDDYSTEVTYYLKMT